MTKLTDHISNRPALAPRPQVVAETGRSMTKCSWPGAAVHHCAPTARQTTSRSGVWMVTPSSVTVTLFKVIMLRKSPNAWAVMHMGKTPFVRFKFRRRPPAPAHLFYGEACRIVSSDWGVFRRKLGVVVQFLSGKAWAASSLVTR